MIDMSTFKINEFSNRQILIFREHFQKQNAFQSNRKNKIVIGDGDLKLSTRKLSYLIKFVEKHLK